MKASEKRAAESPGHRVWNRFRHNLLACIGLSVVCLCALMALLGYWICPDATPNANQMHIEYSIRKPFARFTLLLVRKKKSVDSVGAFEKLLYGQSSFYDEIPIRWDQFTSDSIRVQQYTGVETDTAEFKRFHLVEVVFASKGRIIKKGSSYSFVDIWGRGHHVTRQSLVHRIQTENTLVRTYLLGTDVYGRDLLSRLILGSRISVSVGMIAVIISLSLGVLLGSLAGYYRGWVDGLISWLINVVWALPTLLLVIAISYALGKGLWQVFVAVGLTMWVEVARMVRGQIFSVRQAEYVEAGRALGMSDFRLITRHILPNIGGPILVVAASNFASAILLEAGLSFLGFGARPPFPSWGAMIKENYGYIIIDAAFLALIPGMAIMILVYGFNLLSIGLRDAYDMKDQNTSY